MLSLRVKLIRSCFRQRAFNIVLKPAVNYSVAALSKPERCSPRLSLERSRIFIANMASTSSPSVVHSAAERVFSIQLPGEYCVDFKLPLAVAFHVHVGVKILKWENEQNGSSSIFLLYDYPYVNFQLIENCGI